MEKQSQQVLFKGELMEELVRNYFLNAGYYVVRSVKFTYQTFEITDIDIYLYMRSSGLSRQRINVDLKNKKTPQTFERILWANGLKSLLKFDACIVATTDQRPVIHSFGLLHKTQILDGAFLQKLKTDLVGERIYEEDLLTELAQHRSAKTFNRNWKAIYEESKSKLLIEPDFATFNSILVVVKYFIEKTMYDKQRVEIATRMIYILLSHLMIVIDYLVKDIAFLEQKAREKKLSDGFTFGNLGKDGVEKIISIAARMSGKSETEFRKAVEDNSANILKDYFVRSDVTQNLFSNAKELESLGFAKELTLPNKLEGQLKAFVAMVLDYHEIERKTFFDTFNSES